MARLVSLIAVPHDPTLPIAARLAPEGKAHPGALPALADFETLRAGLDRARPDVVVMIGSDHLNQWFMNNMAPFMVGKATRMTGPFESEIRAWGLAASDLPIHGTLARHVLKDGMNRGVDFAYSDEFVADHSFTIPLQFLRPQGDLPVVPVFVNLLAPPVPPGWRYRQVGETIRRSVESFGDGVRVAIVATGHMSNSVGGPGMLRVQAEPLSEWDRSMWALIEANDVDEITRRSSFDQLFAHGNGTPGFLGYVLAFGAAAGARPTFASLVATGAQPACAFLAWDEAALNGGEA
jgi:protocatechuate 4,5-dioxygenase, beta chain